VAWRAISHRAELIHTILLLIVLRIFLGCIAMFSLQNAKMVMCLYIHLNKLYTATRIKTYIAAYYIYCIGINANMILKTFILLFIFFFVTVFVGDKI